ncbi:DUF1801 domain-containing protein [Wenyingzhuangia sp. IMCC45467]
MNSKVDEHIDKLTQWQEELTVLRHILNECMLTEEYKWKQPCYTYNKKNVIILSGFKDYCSINFFKGSLLKDTDNLLVKPGENSQSSRFIHFTNIDEIIKLKNTLKSYIFEAIEIEKAGLKVKLKQVEDYDVPKELEEQFKHNAELKKAFKALTPGRQKGYLLFFSGAKQSKTKTSRIEKYIPKILEGKGFHDCTCGLSKKMPSCDGSHKYIK